jgi:hypothetical protein
MLAHLTRLQTPFSTPGHEGTFADGAASIELVTAIYASARTGVRTTLPLSKDHAFFNGWLPDQTV